MLQIFWRLFCKNCFAKKSIFTNLWRHEGVNIADFTKKCVVFLLFLTHLTQIYEILTQSILLKIFLRSFKKLFLPKNRFSPIYDVMKVWILLILQKNALFCSFYPINPNIWKINPAYLVANFLKIILKKSVLLKIQFSPNYDVMKVWNLLIIQKKMRFLLFLTHLI